MTCLAQPLAFNVKKVVVPWLVVLWCGMAGPVQAFPSDFDLLGFSRAEYEVLINPCINPSVLQARFGAAADQAQEQELRKWPQGLCQDLEVSHQLVRWKYYYTTLLANTERPTVIAQELVKHKRQLLDCTTTACLSDHLPRMISWVRLNIDRLPVNEAVLGDKPGVTALRGDRVVHPNLALRNLPLPLSGQAQACGSTSIDALAFWTVPFQVSERPLVFVTCAQEGDASRRWLLEQTAVSANNAVEANHSKGWREILSIQGARRFYVMPYQRTTYPTLLSRLSEGQGELISIYDYHYPSSRYDMSVEFALEFDRLGRAHAFIRPFQMLRSARP